MARGSNDGWGVGRPAPHSTKLEAQMARLGTRSKGATLGPTLIRRILSAQEDLGDLLEELGALLGEDGIHPSRAAMLEWHRDNKEAMWRALQLCTDTFENLVVGRGYVVFQFCSEHQALQDALPAEPWDHRHCDCHIELTREGAIRWASYGLGEEWGHCADEDDEHTDAEVRFVRRWLSITPWAARKLRGLRRKKPV